MKLLENLKMQNGLNNLMYSIQRSKNYQIRKLLEYGIKVNEKDNNGWTALMYAVKYCQNDVIDTLITNGADINMKNENEDNAFMLMMYLSLEIDIVLFNKLLPEDIHIKNKQNKSVFIEILKKSRHENNDDIFKLITPNRKLFVKKISSNMDQIVINRIVLWKIKLFDFKIMSINMIKFYDIIIKF